MAAAERPRARAAALSFPALILGNAALAFGPWLVRLADVGPIAAGFWRLAIAAPLLVLLAGASGAPVARVSPRMWLLLAAGGLCFALDLGLWHAGILRTRLANAAMFANIASFTFVAYGFVVARRWPGRAQRIALALAALGVALLLGRSFDLSPRNAVGDLLCIGAGLAYTGYLVAVDRARGAVAPLPALAVATIAGVAPLLLAAMIAGERIMPGAWTPLVLLALGSQLVGQGMIVFAMRHQPPLVVGLALLTQPVVAATIGWIGYGERLGPIDVLGMAIIAAAIVLVRQAGAPAADALPPVAESA